MKNEFYVYEALTLISCPIFFTLSSIFTIFGIIMTIKYSYWILLLMGCFLLILCFVILFGDKRALTKVKFTNDTIFVKRLNKLLFSVDWTEITDVNANTPYNRYSKYLTFVAGDKRIDLVLIKKMYNSIMAICPYQIIKNEINKLEQFKWFHKNENKTNSRDNW